MKKNNVIVFTFFYCIPFAASTPENIYTVRQSTTLCPQEQNYLNLRSSNVKNSLEKFLQLSLEGKKQIPRIALCSSGGGYRAMLATLGFYKATTNSNRQKKLPKILTKKSALNKILSFFSYYYAYLFGSVQDSLIEMPLPTITDNASLFDCCTYCSALSGSSWALAGWLQSRKTIDNYTQHIKQQIDQHFFKYHDSDELAFALSKKYESEQPVTFIDIYGSLLVQTFLSNLGVENPNDFCIGSDREYVDEARIPLPIHCALIGDDLPNYAWVEFTPFEVGSTLLTSFIPISSFGRKFSRGISHDFAQPASLGFCMGIWGSGMCINLKEFLELMQPHLTTYAQTSGTSTQAIIAMLNNKISNLLSMYGSGKNMLTNHRIFSPARVHNWNYNLDNVPLNKQELLTIVDAGIDFRLALPPLLRSERNVDIIIVLDATDRALGTELRETQAYAQLHGLKFPPIDYSIINQSYSVHQDPHDPTVPTIIYFPLIKNDGYCNGWDPRTADFTATYNFSYTQEQSALLLGLTEFTLNQEMPQIIEVIKNWIEERN